MMSGGGTACVARPISWCGGPVRPEPQAIGRSRGFAAHRIVCPGQGRTGHWVPGHESVLVIVVVVQGVSVLTVYVVDVVAVLHRLVTAVAAMRVVVLFGVGMLWGRVFVHMVIVGVMDVSVVQVIDMSVVLHSGVAAVLPVGMGVIAVGVVCLGTHGLCSIS